VDDVRVFIAGVNDVTVVTPAPGVSEAYDILVAGGVHPDKAADLAVKSQKYGKDPVEFAKKFLRAREAIR
jgi:hypothetical protein